MSKIRQHPQTKKTDFEKAEGNTGKEKLTGKSLERNQIQQGSKVI